MVRMVELTLATGAVFSGRELPKSMRESGYDWSTAPKGSWVDKRGVPHPGRERKTGYINTQHYTGPQ